MLAAAAHRWDGRGALATQPQVHSLTGSPLASDHLLTSRQLVSGDGGHIPPTLPEIGDDTLTQHQPRLPLAASLTAGLTNSLTISNATSSSVDEQVLGTIASTFSSMNFNDQHQTSPSNSTLATALAAATGSTLLPPPPPPPPSLASFTGWEWLLITVLISIILISIIGNCLVCVAIFTDRRLRKLGNAFIVSLAIADLFVSCLVMTFALCNDLMNYWMFGEWFCDIWISFDIMCSTASILNLCAISLDRFIHIKDCLLYNQLMTKRVAISAVIIIWIISALVSFVPINLGWHKPNHFKQASNGTADANHQHLDLLAAGLTDELAPGVAGSDPRRARLDDDQTGYEDALEAENRRLALIGHGGSTQDQGQRTRQKRQTRGEGVGAELDEKISEIRDARSQVANKLHPGQILPSSSPAASGLQRPANLAADADAQVLNSGRWQRAGCDRRGNNLSRGPAARSNDDGGDDVSKQSRPDPLGLHGNELSDQVAAPAGEFNLLPRPKQKGERRSRSQPEPPEQIKHSRAAAGPSGAPKAHAAPVEDARWTPHGDAARDSGRPLAAAEPLGDPQNRHEQTDQPTACSNVDNQNAKRQDKTRTKTTAAGRKRRQTQSGAGDEPEAPAKSAMNPEEGGQRQNWATSRPGGGGGGASLMTASSTNPPAAPNELPQCMLTLTPTYAVISSTISFYIPCIIMLGLYSKLFACARRHVRNIMAISKAPQPIGFGAPALAEDRLGGSTIGGPPATNAPPSGSDSNLGEIINCRRPPSASSPQDQTAQASSLLLSSSQTVTTVTGTTRPNAAGPTVNNNGRAAGTDSLGSQCRANLARLVRRPEPKLASESRSRTWIKFGRQPAGTLKSSSRAPKSEQVESVLSTSSKLLPQMRDAAQQNPQKVAPNSAGLMMKLNSNNNNQRQQQQQNARSQTTATNRRADRNDAGAGLPSDNNETIAHGNETEPFLNGRNTPGRPERPKPEVAEADLSSGRLAVSQEDLAGYGGGGGCEPSEPDDETNPSRATTNASAGGAQIMSATSTAFTSAAAPFKSSFTSNHSHQANLQQQQQRHGGSWRKHLQSQQNKQQTNQLATHKAAITLGIIMGTFLFCWVPFFCLNIIKAFHGDSIPSSLFRAFTWLGYANSALNPIIYGIHNSEFRNAFNRIFFKHLTLKNGRQYLNRRFSYDLRPHVQESHQQYEQTRWPNNINNRQNCPANTLEVSHQQRLLTDSEPANEAGLMSQQQRQQLGPNVAHRHHH